MFDHILWNESESKNRIKPESKQRRKDTQDRCLSDPNNYHLLYINPT